jgi:hypothetical protein
MNPMTDEEVEAKLRRLCTSRYSDDQIGKILQHCWTLPALNDPARLIHLVN